MDVNNGSLNGVTSNNYPEIFNDTNVLVEENFTGMIFNPPFCSDNETTLYFTCNKSAVDTMIFINIVLLIGSVIGNVYNIWITVLNRRMTVKTNRSIHTHGHRLSKKCTAWISGRV